MAPDAPRVALVVPRYGPEVLGGAETLCRQLAENLVAHGADVEVLTTCAVDHFSWADHHPAGTTEIGGVQVHRFPVADRDHDRWWELHTRIGQGLPVGDAETLEWMGNSVWSEGLLDAACDEGRYDWAVCIPYLFGTTFWVAAERRGPTAVISCLHDEPYARLPPVRRMLAGADGCIVLTEGERRLVHDLAPDARTRLVGVGFDETEAPSAEATSRFCADRGIDPGYLLYAGRREAAKGLPEMFANYAELRRNVADAPKLALMGGGEIDLPADVAPHVIDLGFVDDGDRGAAYAAASVLLHPSRLESLGMVLLESWLAGTPAVVNGASPVLHEHCAASGGGLWYREGRRDGRGRRAASRGHRPSGAHGARGRRLRARGVLVAGRAQALPRRPGGMVGARRRHRRAGARPPVSDGVHQVLAGAAARDAITIHALAARDVLRDMGLRSEVVCEADHIDPALGGQVRPHTGWDTLAEPGDAAILHYSIASPAFWDVAGRTDRLAIHYHNITPARLLWEFAPGIAIECADGRRRLGELADRVRWAAADSSFNAGELEELGFPPARVVGVMRRPSLPAPGAREDHARTRLLFVGRGVPNKAQHHLVMALAALREGGIDAELRLVGSWAGIEDYRAHCEALAAALGVDEALTITGSVDDQRLADEYGGADLFLCLSDHEGYCVPLVEAMEHDLPIVAYAQGAIPETAGRAGLLLDEKPPSLVAEAVAETLANDALRARMAAGRAERLDDLSHERVAERVREFVMEMS